MNGCMQCGVNVIVYNLVVCVHTPSGMHSLLCNSCIRCSLNHSHAFTCYAAFTRFAFSVPASRRCRPIPRHANCFALRVNAQSDCGFQIHNSSESSNYVFHKTPIAAPILTHPYFVFQDCRLFHSWVPLAGTGPSANLS